MNSVNDDDPENFKIRIDPESNWVQVLREGIWVNIAELGSEARKVVGEYQRNFPMQNLKPKNLEWRPTSRDVDLEKWHQLQLGLTDDSEWLSSKSMLSGVLGGAAIGSLIGGPVGAIALGLVGGLLGSPLAAMFGPALSKKREGGREGAE